MFYLPYILFLFSMLSWNIWKQCLFGYIFSHQFYDGTISVNLPTDEIIVWVYFLLRKLLKYFGILFLVCVYTLVSVYTLPVSFHSSHCFISGLESSPSLRHWGNRTQGKTRRSKPTDWMAVLGSSEPNSWMEKGVFGELELSYRGFLSWDQGSISLMFWSPSFIFF